MLELENLKARCKQLATELDKARKTMHTEREEFHLKETKLEASLTASRKANLELEVRKDSQDNYIATVSGCTLVVSVSGLIVQPALCSVHWQVHINTLTCTL